MINLAAPASPKIHLAGLDLLRAFAISFVFFFHYPNPDFPDWIMNIKAYGWTGVDLFFVLSGFLIASHLFAQIKSTNDFSLKTFIIKRAFRILPAYFVVLAIYFSLPAFREKEALPALWRFLTFTQNLGLDGIHGGTFSHAWSLCIEEQFYFVFPLIVLLLLSLKVQRFGIWIIAGLFILTCVLRVLIWTNYFVPANYDVSFWLTWMYYPTFTRLDGLLVGICIAALYVFRPTIFARLGKYANVILLSGIALFIVAGVVAYDRLSFNANVFGFPLIAFSCGLMVMSAVMPRSILYKTKSAIISGLATLSYSIYLSHKGVVHICREFFGKFGVDEDGLLMFTICAFFSIIAAILLRYIVEKPFLKLRDVVLKN